MAEQSTEKLRIRLHVYDTDMPVNIRPEDEPLYRDAASLLPSINCTRMPNIQDANPQVTNT